MTKELEAFRDILGILSAVSGYEVDMNSERVKIVEQALHRLEAIDNANPSEALENIGNIDLGDNPYKTFEHNKLKNVYSADFNAIKQALLKAQEQEQYYFDLIQLLKENNMDYYTLKEMFKTKSKKEQALEIIKEKRVDLPYLRCCIEDNQSVERYNEYINNKTMDYDHEEELTEKEFYTLKEVLE